jgi:hypothetical protein
MSTACGERLTDLSDRAGGWACLSAHLHVRFFDRPVGGQALSDNSTTVVIEIARGLVLSAGSAGRLQRLGARPRARVDRFFRRRSALEVIGWREH